MRSKSMEIICHTPDRIQLAIESRSIPVFIVKETRLSYHKTHLLVFVTPVNLADHLRVMSFSFFLFSHQTLGPRKASERFLSFAFPFFKHLELP